MTNVKLISLLKDQSGNQLNNQQDDLERESGDRYRRNNQRKKKSTIYLLCFAAILTAIFLTGCGSERSISTIAIEAIEKDLKTQIEPSICKYNEEKQLAYVVFSSEEYQQEETILRLDEKNHIETILYQHIYDALTDQDYELKKDYGIYALSVYDIQIGDDRWIDVELP